MLVSIVRVHKQVFIRARRPGSKWLDLTLHQLGLNKEATKMATTSRFLLQRAVSGLKCHAACCRGSSLTLNQGRGLWRRPLRHVSCSHAPIKSVAPVTGEITLKLLSWSNLHLFAVTTLVVEWKGRTEGAALCVCWLRGRSDKWQKERASAQWRECLQGKDFHWEWRGGCRAFGGGRRLK